MQGGQLGGGSVSEMRPYDIAVDPYSRLLFWSDEGHDVINITRLDFGLIHTAAHSFAAASQHDHDQAVVTQVVSNCAGFFHSFTGEIQTNSS